MSKRVGMLFSAKPNNAQLAVEHLKNNSELYWTTTFKIKGCNYSLPAIGLMHIKGDKVRYKCKIIDIREFKPFDYDNPAKNPEPWRNGYHNMPAVKRTTFVITEMLDFSYGTKNLVKVSGIRVKRPPQKHTRVYIPLREEI